MFPKASSRDSSPKTALLSPCPKVAPFLKTYGGHRGHALARGHWDPPSPRTATHAGSPTALLFWVSGSEPIWCSCWLSTLLSPRRGSSPSCRTGATLFADHQLLSRPCGGTQLCHTPGAELGRHSHNLLCVSCCSRHRVSALDTRHHGRDPKLCLPCPVVSV